MTLADSILFPNAVSVLDGSCPSCNAQIRWIESDPEQIACRHCGTKLVAESLVNPELSSLVPHRLGRYELLENVGEGGYAKVWKTWDTVLGRTVALKLPSTGNASLDPAGHARLVRESKVAARLSHPHLLPLHDASLEGDLPILVFPFIHGPTMAALIRNRRPDHETSVDWMCAVAAALDHLHCLGVVHRDIKPGNILLDPVAENPLGSGFTPRLADYGLARVESNPRVTQIHHSAGTPAYMAPERFNRPQHDDTRSDIYSLGAVLFELLSGRLPFTETGLELSAAVLNQEAPSLRKLVPGVSGDLAAIVARCLDKDPSCRYASASDLAADLERWRRGASIHARPTGALRQILRRARRKPLTATLVAGSVLAVASLGTISSMQWLRVKQSHEEARAAKSESQAALERADENIKQRAHAELAAAEARRALFVAKVLPTDSNAHRISADARELHALRLAKTIMDTLLARQSNGESMEQELRELDAFYSGFPTGEMIAAGRLITLSEIQANQAIIARSLGQTSKADFLAQAASESLLRAQDHDIGAYGNDASNQPERLRLATERVVRAQATSKQDRRGKELEDNDWR